MEERAWRAPAGWIQESFGKFGKFIVTKMDPGKFWKVRKFYCNNGGSRKVLESLESFNVTIMDSGKFLKVWKVLL